DPPPPEARLATCPAQAPQAPRRQVRILDLPTTRVRRPSDLVHLLLSAVGLAVVLILSVYAYSTAAGVTQDVQSALAQAVRGVLLVPVNVIEGFLTLVLPEVVIVARLLRRNLRGGGGAGAAGAGGVAPAVPR